MKNKIYINRFLFIKKDDNWFTDNNQLPIDVDNALERFANASLGVTFDISYIKNKEDRKIIENYIDDLKMDIEKRGDMIK